MSDVIQEARDALDLLRDAVPASLWPPKVGRDAILYRIVEAADAGHLIDTRRIEALADGSANACLECAGAGLWRVWREADALPFPRRSTASEALAAAEREAQ